MWRTLGRIVVVVLFWAGASVGAARAGIAAAEAELFAGIGAGLSLIAWAVALHRAAHAATPAERTDTQPSLPRERATS